LSVFKSICPLYAPRTNFPDGKCNFNAEIVPDLMKKEPGGKEGWPLRKGGD
jgi:hypothetical protein